MWGGGGLINEFYVKNVNSFFYRIQDDNVVAGFLDRTLTSRLGIRMLVHHHLLIQDSRVGSCAASRS